MFRRDPDRLVQPSPPPPVTPASGRAHPRLAPHRAAHVGLALAVLVAGSGTALTQEEGEIERLEGQVESCEQALERRQGTAELALRRRQVDDAKRTLDRAEQDLWRLRTDLHELRAAERDARTALDGAPAGEERERRAARLAEAVKARQAKEEAVRLAEAWADRARQEHADTEYALSMLQTRLGVERRDVASIEAECGRLRERLAAARAARADAAPTRSPADPWGLEQGHSWTEETTPPTPSADDWWHEEGGSRDTGDDRHPTPPPPATPPGSRPAPTPSPPGPGGPPNRTDLGVGAGPYHEFAALCRLGWASSLARHSVGPADVSIAEHLRMAGAHLREANRTTFDPLRAWPDWAGRQNHYDAIADRLPGAGETFRRQLAQELETGWSGLVDDLAWQLAGELQHRETCDSHYARLGYTLCFGQQSLQIAEVAERQGDRELMQAAAREGRDRLGAARRELEALPRVPLATGRCVDLEPARRRLAPFPGGGGLSAQVEIANAVFEETVRLLAGSASQPLQVQLGSVSATGWTWGANLNIGVLLTPEQPFTVTRIRRCAADWSPNPQQCQAETRTRMVDGSPRTFCCTGDWLTGQIAVPGYGTVKITWPHGPQNRVPIPAGVTVNLGTLYTLAATQGDFDHDASFALILGVDAGGQPVEIESPVFRPRDHFPSYEAMCRQVGSATSR